MVTNDVTECRAAWPGGWRKEDDMGSEPKSGHYQIIEVFDGEKSMCTNNGPEVAPDNCLAIRLS